MIVYIVYNNAQQWLGYDYFLADGPSLRHVDHSKMFWVIFYEMTNYSRQESIYPIDPEDFDGYAQKALYTLHPGFFNMVAGCPTIEQYVDRLLLRRMEGVTVNHMNANEAIALNEGPIVGVIDFSEDGPPFEGTLY